MGRSSLNVAAAAGLMIVCGCAALGSSVNRAPIQQLDEHGLSAPVQTVETGDIVEFINRDVRPHQIYSNDCAELSSTVLRPGDTYSVAVGLGPKVCHFQDLLAPLSSQYSGTLTIHDEQEERRRETSD